MSHNSYITQRLANRTPDWADSRAEPCSFFQQFLNPIGEELESLYKYSITENKNHRLRTANADLMDQVWLVKLNNDFTFGIDKFNPLTPWYAVPTISASLNSVTITPTVADDNSLDNMWYNSYPTRVVDAQISETIEDIVSETVLASLSVAVIKEIPIANTLYITIAGCVDFIDIKRSEPLSFVMLHGITDKNIEETEVVFIPFNGMYSTLKVWKELWDINYYGLNPIATGTIKVEWMPFNRSREADKYMLSVEPWSEKLLYHKLGTQTWGSTHCHMVTIANTIQDLHSGNDTLQIRKEIELGWDNAGTFTNVDLNDIAVQPFTGRLFGIDDTYLYIFSPYDSHSDCRNMRARTDGCSLRVNVDGYDFLRGDEVIIEPSWDLPTRRIRKNRWSIIKPDGTIIYLNIKSQSVAAANAWISNQTDELQFGPFAYDTKYVDKQRLAYTLDQRGTYTIVLETMYEDNTTEKDILPIQVHYKVADARIVLPANLQGSTGIAFDYDQKLWLLQVDASGVNTASQVTLATDNFVIDQVNKVIVFHEQYDTVTVQNGIDLAV